MFQYRAEAGWFRLLLAREGSFSPGVPWRVAVCGALALVVALLNRRGIHLRIPLGIHEVAGAVLALVLAFRTNTAYARFWEGRSLWGAMVNASRNLTRIVRTHGTEQREASREFAVWVVLFAHATRRRLRRESVYEEAKRLLPEDAEAVALAARPHPPLHCAAQLELRLSEFQRKGLPVAAAIECEKQLSVLIDSLGGCEKIKYTPTPLSFVVLAQRFVVVFLATLPLAIVEEAGAFTPFVVLVVAYPLLMIDALGGELDDPFEHDPNDLPLTRICQTIEGNLLSDQDDRDRLVQSTLLLD